MYETIEGTEAVMTLNPDTKTTALGPECIEILSVDLLDQNRALVEDLKRLAAALGLEFGWHYLLDLTWIISRLGEIQGKKLVDAGAGTGILQWYLAREGAQVVSVDRLNRAALPLRFRRQFRAAGLRDEDLLPASRAFLQNFNRPGNGPFYRRWAVRLAGQAKDLIGAFRSPPPAIRSAAARHITPDTEAPDARLPGRVLIYNQDLTHLEHLDDASVDAVVSVSALEHNTPDGLTKVVGEIMRVLKPGGMLLATLTAGRDQDWWHEASSGWCYSDTSLRRLFDLAPEVPSNYSQYDVLFDALKNCAELKDNLASFYFQSQDKGMPGGKWAPQYQPVGVCKAKI
jgi:ubiquinone/menaquinone biosynthesis C-methylase UbiE